MQNTLIDFKKEDGIAFSKQKLYLKNFNVSVDVWVYTEDENLEDFSKNKNWHLMILSLTLIFSIFIIILGNIIKNY